MKNIHQFLMGICTLLLGLSLLTSCTKEAETGSKASSNPVANQLDPGTASGNDVLTLTGNGLGEMVRIVFENGSVPASFNPVLNTNESLVFRVPDTANGGNQHIIFTNKLGVELKVPFNVIALPLVSEVSNYNFSAGTEITLTGNNLEDVNKVVFATTTTNVDIVSKSKKKLVVRFPASTLNRSKLEITNASGSITTSQEFVNIDRAFKIFTDDYAAGFQDASWGSPGTISNTIAKSGTASVFKTYAAGNWHQLGFGWTNISNDSYQFLSFWIKGGTKEYSLWISSQTSVGGFASFEPSNRITVPANVWTYFKIPMSTLNLWATGTSFNQLGWRIQGPDGNDETFYLDDVILVK